MVIRVEQELHLKAFFGLRDSRAAISVLPAICQPTFSGNTRIVRALRDARFRWKWLAGIGVANGSLDRAGSRGGMRGRRKQETSREQNRRNAHDGVTAG